MAKKNLGEGLEPEQQVVQGTDTAPEQQVVQGTDTAPEQQVVQGTDAAPEQQVVQGTDTAAEQQVVQGTDPTLFDENIKLEDAGMKIETKKVRVLSNCVHGKANDVVELTVEEIKSAKDDGFVDDHPDAVAYAESLQAAE